MSKKRLSPIAIHFSSDVAWSGCVMPNFRRHRWLDFLTPLGWVYTLAMAGSLMLGAAVAFAT